MGVTGFQRTLVTLFPTPCMTWSRRAMLPLATFFLVLKALPSSVLCPCTQNLLLEYFISQVKFFVCLVPCIILDILVCMQTVELIHQFIELSGCVIPGLWFNSVSGWAPAVPTLNNLLTDDLSCSLNLLLCDRHPCFSVQPVFCGQPPNSLKPSLRLLLTYFRVQDPTLG